MSSSKYVGCILNLNRTVTRNCRRSTWLCRIWSANAYNLRGMKRYWPHDYYIIIKLAQVSKKKLMPIPGVRWTTTFLWKQHHKCISLFNKRTPRVHSITITPVASRLVQVKQRNMPVPGTRWTTAFSVKTTSQVHPKLKQDLSPSD
jgi:hypothetical protein